jgi:hypothetical protein
MPRSKVRAAHRAARLAAEGRVEGQGDDAGRTPARVDYVRREIRRRLGITVARTALADGTRQVDPPPCEAEAGIEGDME